MDSDQSGAVGGIIWGPFQGSLTHLGASRGLQSHTVISGEATILESMVTPIGTNSSVCPWDSTYLVGFGEATQTDVGPMTPLKDETRTIEM